MIALSRKFEGSPALMSGPLIKFWPFWRHIGEPKIHQQNMFAKTHFFPAKAIISLKSYAKHQMNRAELHCVKATAWLIIALLLKVRKSGLRLCEIQCLLKNIIAYKPPNLSRRALFYGLILKT